MYLWRMDRLKEDLVSGTLTERSRFLYFFVFVMLYALVSEFPSRPDEPNVWDRSSSVAVLLITAMGTYWAYRENGGRAGHRFLERYLSISLVFFVRLLVVTMPLILIAGLIAGILDKSAAETTGPFDFAVLVLVGVVYFAGICRHIRHVVAMERAAQPGASNTQ